MHRADDPRRYVGDVVEASETDDGLAIKGLFDRDTEFGKSGRNTKGRRVSGLSIGYAIRDSTKTAAGHEMTDLELIEVPIVARGANPAASISSIKSATPRLSIGLSSATVIRWRPGALGAGHRVDCQSSIDYDPAHPRRLPDTSHCRALKVTSVAGAGSIQPTDKTGRMGVMYVRSILAQAGVINNEVPGGEDHLAVDLTLVFPVGPVTVQVKAGTAKPNNDGSITVPVEESWRQKWAQTITPVFLVYVRLEKDSPGDWVDHADLHTLLHVRAHWLKVNAMSGASVRVPLANRLTIDTFESWVTEFNRFGKAASA